MNAYSLVSSFAEEQAEIRYDSEMAEHERDVAALRLALTEVERCLVSISDRGVEDYSFTEGERRYGSDISEDLRWVRALLTAEWDIDPIHERIWGEP